jgi:hypothetical protein
VCSARVPEHAYSRPRKRPPNGLATVPLLGTAGELRECDGHGRIGVRASAFPVKQLSALAATIHRAYSSTAMRDMYDFRAKSAIVALGLVTILAVLSVLWDWLA